MIQLIFNMSLELELLQIKGVLRDKCTIRVQGSQAGTLIVHKNSTSYKIKCNKLNILKFTINTHESNDQKKGKLFAAQFSAQRFLKENKANPDLYKQVQKIDYEINIVDSDKVIGSLKFGIIYIKGLIYMGEKFGNFETLPQKEPLKIFQGVCQTRNLFNFFDHGSADKSFGAVQSSYRDGTFD